VSTFQRRFRILRLHCPHCGEVFRIKLYQAYVTQEFHTPPTEDRDLSLFWSSRRKEGK